MLVDRLFEKVEPRLQLVESGCLEFMGARTSDGYGVVRYQNRCYYTHRIAWERASGRRVPDGLLVMHTCDNPCCCNPDHLRVGTRADNSRDMIAKGRARHPGPTKAGRPMTDAQMEYIDQRRGKVPARVIARELGLSYSAVYRYLWGKTYRDKRCIWYRIPGMTNRGYVTSCENREHKLHSTCPHCGLRVWEPA